MGRMSVALTDLQIKELVAKACIETEREIYSISFDLEEIRINESWSTPITNKSKFHESLISAIEHYCTQENIEWEYSAEYSAWCD